MTSHLPGRLGGLLLLAALGCGGLGDKTGGDRAGQLNGEFRITPATATVITGQTVHFTASGPGGGGATWAVQPAASGTIDAAGNFTASSTLGTCQIVAFSTKDVRYTATASVSIVAPGPPAVITPHLVQASGRPQASGDGAIRSTPVMGEAVPAQKAASATGSIEVRHGFEPPPTP
jgi:hypothetical protein